MKNLNIKKYLPTILLIFLFLFSEKSTSRELRWSKELMLIVPFITTLLLFAIKIFIRKKITKDFLLIIFILIGFFCLSLFLNNTLYELDNYPFIVISISSLFLIFSLNKYELIRAYSNSIIFFSIYSLIANYILQPLYMQGLLNIFPVYTNILGNTYIDFFFSYSLRYFGLIRNQGYFNEPGVFQFYILISISIEVYFLKNKNKLRTIILLITFLTISSTAGIISIFFIFIPFFIQLFKAKRITLTLFLSINLLFLLIILSYDSLIFYHLDKIINQTGSLIPRVKIIDYFLNFFDSNPIFGLSFTKLYSNIFSFDINAVDVTGTHLIFILALGFPIGIFLIYSFIKTSTLIFNKKSLLILPFYLGLFLSAMSQNLTFDFGFLLYSFLWINAK
jgi:hypothetical protein